MPRTRSRWRVVLAIAVLLFAVIQVVPYGHARTNPPVAAEPSWDSAQTRALTRQACFDCHSNETEWPLYSRVAPVSWLVRHDVDEGRAALNFSEWHRPQKEADEAAKAVREGEMPMRIYQLMHAHARLSDADRQRLAAGLERTLGAGKRTKLPRGQRRPPSAGGQPGG